MSLGLDGSWRSSAAKESLINKNSYSVIDLAAGTGDLSIAIFKACRKDGRKVSITGVDFNRDMLEIARSKAKRLKFKINFEEGDALALRFSNNRFDVAASAFGLRNFDSLDGFAREAHRILKKDGKLVLLDMAEPEDGIMKCLSSMYLKIILLEGMLINPNAYSFLVSSIKKFDKGKLPVILKKHGFDEIKILGLPSGVAFMVTARKP
jgi:demethylmenaquinone methyltransferase/2-methoxy-6-polyprenyl-1,4-benzoquinol methylase